jgi:hypothetical protein
LFICEYNEVGILRALLVHTGQKSRLQDSELWELLKKNRKKIGIVGTFEKKIGIVGTYSENM